jgi:PKD repeat protein
MKALRSLAGTRLARAFLAVPLLGGVLVLSQGDGFPERRLSLSGGGAWLASSSVGQLSLIDGASAELAAKVKVADTPAELEAVQAGAGAYAIDRSRGTLVRVDGRTYAPSPAVEVIQGASSGLQAFAGRQTVFVLDRTRGLVVSADPVSLRVRQQLPLVASVAEGAGVVDGADRLWLLDQASGDLVWLDAGAKRTLPRAADPARARLVRVGERVALVDLAARTARVLDPSSGRPGAQGCVDVDPGDPSMVVNGSAAAPRVHIVSGRRGVLLVSDVERGRCDTVVPVSDPGADLGAPQEAAGRVFVPNYSTGSVVVVDLATGQVVADRKVLGPGRFELLSKDGVVFYNDPGSQRAGVIRLDGTTRPVRKYNPQNPGQGLVQPDGADPTAKGGGQPAPPPDQSPSGTTTGPTTPAAVQIQASATRARVGDPITFRVVASAGGRVASARWSFGDHATAEGTEVAHGWRRPGTFTVLVQATLSNGTQETVSATIVIDTTTPLDPGPGPGPGPGPDPGTSTSSTTSSSTTSSSTTSTSTTTSTLPEPAPDITSITLSSNPAEVGESVNFSATVTNGPTTWGWEVSRGGTVVVRSNQQSFDHAFTEPGSYTTSLTVSNASGNDSMSEPLTVNARPLPADLVPGGFTRAAFRFNITVRNQGSGDAASSRMFVDLPSGFGTDCDLPVPAIPAHGSTVITCQTNTCIDYCTVEFSVTVDFAREIPESDEGNNVVDYVYCLDDPLHPCP